MHKIILSSLILLFNVADAFCYKTVNVNNNIGRDVAMSDTLTETLSDVTVNGVRKVISYDRDRMVYNVQQTPWAKGFNALDVVTKMPWADPTKRDEDAISLVGKDGVIVLINDRKLNLQGKQLTSYLKNIKSEDIVKVEVMTNPSPEFSAEGNNGVINIVTKQRRNLGFEGNVNAGYEQHRKATFTESANLGFSNKFMEIAYNIHNGNENNYSNVNRDYDYATYSRTSEQTTRMKYNSLSQNCTVNFFLNDHMNLGFMTTYSYTKYSSDIDSKVCYTNRKIENVEEKTDMDGRFNYFSIAPYYEWNIDSLGKKLTMNYAYIRSNGKENKHYTANTALPFYDYVADNPTVYQCYNLDMRLPFAWMNFEAGGEYRKYNVDNQSEYSSLDVFHYNENVLSVYADMNKTFGKWYAKLGARYEYSKQEGTSNTTSGDVNLKYGKLFPFMDVTYHLTDEQSLVFGYSKRIERLGMYLLNPTRSYSDSYLYFSGSPQLKPAMLDYLEMKYMYSNLYVGLSYVYTKDVIDNISQEDKDGVMNIQYVNGLNVHSLGLNANYTLNIKKLSANFGGSISYNKSTPIISQLSDKNLKGVISRLSCDFAYKFRDNLTAFAEYFYVFPGLSQDVHISSYQSFSLGLNMRLLKDKLSVEVGARDIFNTNKSKNRVEYTTYTFTSKFDNDIRNVYVKLSYRFQKNNVRHSYVEVNNFDSRISSK